MWTHGSCGRDKATASKDGSAIVCTMSNWELTEEIVRAALKTERGFLTLYGSRATEMPVVSGSSLDRCVGWAKCRTATLLSCCKVSTSFLMKMPALGLLSVGNQVVTTKARM